MLSHEQDNRRARCNAHDTHSTEQHTEIKFEVGAGQGNGINRGLHASSESPHDYLPPCLSLPQQLMSLWESCFQQRYGLLRPAVVGAMEAYLDCGVYERGCVRIRCPDCSEELYLAFSYKRRGICASCAAKRGVMFGEKLHNEVLANVPHQHVVFTIPKRIRPYFLRDRTLLGILFRGAWKALKSLLGSSQIKTVPGAVMALHTAQ